MPPTVAIDDIADALDMYSDQRSKFLNLQTGEVVNVSKDLLHIVEEYEDDERPDLPEWQYEEWEDAKKIVSGFPVDYLRLPEKQEIPEWDIMQEFSESVESNRIREELLNGIRGRGAFRDVQGYRVPPPHGEVLVCVPHRGSSPDRHSLVGRSQNPMEVTP